ncbi:ArsR/SmtB family transcription factor [Candidatus Pollutiaquabacter sp.]|uniref:ArsR/SmtB family transcription factor n=1 Tax=Candidatus Pollutiaquabacter sp. TaxID=3416354 RepID=UPI003D126E4D
MEEHPRLSVNELCSNLECEQSLVSHHLSNMRIKGLLKAEREGTNIYYSLKAKEVSQIRRSLRIAPATCDSGLLFLALEYENTIILEYSWPFRVSRFEFPVGRKIV